MVFKSKRVYLDAVSFSSISIIFVYFSSCVKAYRLHKIMEMFFPANVLQCNIVYSVVHVYNFSNHFYLLRYISFLSAGVVAS